VVGGVSNTVLPEPKSAVLDRRVLTNLDVVERAERTRRLQRKPAERQTDDMPAGRTDGPRAAADIQSVDACQVVSVVERKVVARYNPAAGASSIRPTALYHR